MRRRLSSAKSAGSWVASVVCSTSSRRTRSESIVSGMDRRVIQTRNLGFRVWTIGCPPDRQFRRGYHARPAACSARPRASPGDGAVIEVERRQRSGVVRREFCAGYMSSTNGGSYATRPCVVDDAWPLRHAWAFSAYSFATISSLKWDSRSAWCCLTSLQAVPKSEPDPALGIHVFPRRYSL
jgi:hypothetical protein